MSIVFLLFLILFKRKIEEIDKIESLITKLNKSFGKLLQTNGYPLPQLA